MVFLGISHPKYFYLLLTNWHILNRNVPNCIVGVLVDTATHLVINELSYIFYYILF